MSKQPDWKFLINLGDVNPIEHGGYFIFEDVSGLYLPEVELYIPETREVYRFPLDNCDWLNDEDLNSVASFIGISAKELHSMLNDGDPIDLAEACRAVGNYFGFVNFDSYPLILESDEEAEERYKDYL